MPNYLADFRQRYPQYDDMSDRDLARAFHKKFYSDMPEDEYFNKLGLTNVTKVKPEEPTFTESMGRGFMDILQGAKEAALQTGAALGITSPEQAKAYSEAVQREIGLYERARGEGLDIGRFAGQVAPFVAAPLGAATMAGRAGLGALTAAGEEAILPGAPEERLTRAAIAAPTAAVAAPVAELGARALAPVAQRLYEDTTRKMRSIGDRIFPGMAAETRKKIEGTASDAAERIMQEIDASPDDLPAGIYDRLLKDAEDQLRHNGEFDTEALSRKAIMDEFGLNPTTGQITRDPTTFAREQNLAKIVTEEGEVNPLMRRLTSQREKILNLAKEFSGNDVPEAGMMADQARRLAEAVDSLRAAKVSARYEAAKATPEADISMPTEALAKQFDPIFRDFEDILPEPITKRVREFIGGDRSYSLREADKLIKLINDRWNETNRPLMTALGRTKDAVRNDMEEFGAALNNEAAQGFIAGSKLHAERMNELAPKAVKELLKPDYKADVFIENQIIRGDYSHLVKLYDFFRRAPKGYKKSTEEVFNGLRQQVDKYLLDKSLREGGNFNGNAYSRALKSIGDRKGKLIYGVEQWNKRKRFSQAIENVISVPAGAPVNYSNTASAMLQYLRSANVTATGLGSGAIGTLLGLDLSTAGLATLAGLAAPIVSKQLQKRAIKKAAMAPGRVYAPTKRASTYGTIR